MPIRRGQTHHGIFAPIVAYVPHLDAVRLVYGLKLALAVLIALWIELQFSLGMPGSVVICVLIVASSTLGTTIQKSVLRMIGNLIGCSLGLVFLELFAQDRVGGAVAFSLYSVICCFFLLRSRYAPAWHWTYDSAALVFFFHIGTATESFSYTSQRWLELSIGIISMTLVSSILWPSRAGKVFEGKFLPMLQELSATVGSLRSALHESDGPEAPAVPTRLASQITGLRSALNTASRDTSRYERFHDRYESLIDGLQALIARATLLSGSFTNLNTTTENPARLAHLELVAAALDHIKASLDALVEHARRHFEQLPPPTEPPDISSVHAAADRIRSEIKLTDYGFRDAATTLHVCEMITSMAQEIERFTDALVHVEHRGLSQPKLSAVQSLDSDQTPFWKRLDVRKSAVCGLTVGLAFAVWMMTNWPAGPLGIFFAVLVTSKNCTLPYLPPRAMIPGLVVGLFTGAVIYLGVLPNLDGFLQLALFLFPFCAVCGYLTLSPNAKVGGMAGLTAIIAILLMDLQAHQTYSFSHIVGLSFGILGGTILAFIVLTVMWPIIPEKLFTSEVKAVFSSCQKRLSVLSTEGVTNPASQARFAMVSAKHLGLCALWSKFLNYGRLPADSRRTIEKLISDIQVTIFHLIEVERMQHNSRFHLHAELLSPIARRLSHELCDALDGMVHALEQLEPVKHSSNIESLLNELHLTFDHLCDDIADETDRRDAASYILAMVGEYGVLTKAVEECRDQLNQLDWKTLNQNYF